MTRLIVVTDNAQAVVDRKASGEFERFDGATWVPFSGGDQLGPGAYRTSGAVTLVDGSAIIWDPENPPPPPVTAMVHVAGMPILFDRAFVYAGLK